jgi:hypothetical protein
MIETNVDQLKYPIGLYQPQKNPDDKLLSQWIGDIATFPNRLEELVHNLSKEELAWKYRPDGWSIKQLVHHCADSHLNSFMRFKLTLTEESPTIRPYLEHKWAELPDALADTIDDSLDLLKGLHNRWTILISNLTKEELNREYVHPEHGKRFNLAETVGNYAWHGNHHLAHVRQAIASKGTYN